MSEQKDRPDREKIGDLINGFVNKQSFTSQDLDQILALIPDIKAVRKQASDAIKGIVKMYEEDEANTVEEAKKQERERIKTIYNKCLVNNPIKAMTELEQALKEEK